MSHNNNDLEKRMSSINMGSISNYLLNEDYKTIFQTLIHSRTDQLKSHLKEILSTLRDESSLFKFINGLVDILKSNEIYWQNPDNIKAIFNEIDEAHLSLYSTTGKLDKPVPQLNAIIEKVIENYLSEVELLIKKYINNQECNFLNATTVLMKFTHLLDIKNYEPILYPMAKFGENLFVQYNSITQLQPLIVEFILNINHRLVNYLAVVPGNPVSKGLKESIYVYSTVRDNIVSLIYTNPDIITKALSILEQRSRFFGLTADAIPENENHGDYIVVDPLNSAFEDDDVYDDYERFLANLPN